MATPTQSFQNHAHRPTTTAVAFAFLVVAVAAQVNQWLGHGGVRTAFFVQGGIFGALMTLILISRTYITRLQDRIIRIEMRVRAASLLTPEQQRQLAGLTLKQVAALRFASDRELGPLVERASRERLQPSDIKRAVQDWQPDFERT